MIVADAVSAVCMLVLIGLFLTDTCPKGIDLSVFFQRVLDHMA